MERRLTAILAADVVGYSRLMGTNEVGTLAALKAHRRELVDGKIAEHHGRIVKLTGDGMLVEFNSVVNAVACATEIQRRMVERNADVPAERRIEFRIGVHLGDIIVDENDIYGDGVNIAARIEGVARPGGVAVSGSVRDNVGNRLALFFEDMGEQKLKNIDRPIRVFHLVPGRSHSALDVQRSHADDKPSIAVLPFNNLSGDPEQEYFSDGITEDIITDLSKISGLFVVGRNTVFTYKGKPAKLTQIAAELGVRFILEGSVRKAGQRVRITGQLIDGRDGGHVWADRYDRELTDIFGIQDEITTTIVEQLKVKLLPEEREAIGNRSTFNPDAYQLYLMGRHYFELRGVRNYEIALRFCTRALESDAEYARAWALSALCQSYLNLSGRSNGTGIEAAEKACLLDPTLAEAHAAMGRILAELGRFDEALREHEESLRLEPDSFDVRNNFGLTCLELGRYQDTVEHLELAARLSETDHASLNLLALAHRALGQEPEFVSATHRCLERIERQVAAHPENANAIAQGALALARLGHRERATEWITRAMIMEPDDATDQYNIACALAQMQEGERAIALLETCVPRMPAEFGVWVRQDFDLKPLHGHPRYAALADACDLRLARAGGAQVTSPDGAAGYLRREVAHQGIVD